jgi:hypothetical protein
VAPVSPVSPSFSKKELKQQEKEKKKEEKEIKKHTKKSLKEFKTMVKKKLLSDEPLWVHSFKPVDPSKFGSA